MSAPTPPRPARTLPPVPNLEQQKKLARELLEAARAGDVAALTRIREHHPRLGDLSSGGARQQLALHHAQVVIAREYGFASWARLKEHIEATPGTRRTLPVERELSYYDDRAQGLLEVLADPTPATLEQVRSWHPLFSDASDEAIHEAVRAGAFALDDARLVYARQHGFASWDRFAAHLRRLARGNASEPFIQIIEAGKQLDFRRVAALLRKHLSLVNARGTNGNTLLNLASAMAPCASPTSPRERVAIAALGGDRLAPLRLLLSLGADPNIANDRGWTPLHQAGYRNDPEMARLLLASGAQVDVEAHGPGGTPLVVALFWGHREAAELLAATAVTPRNLRVAAGLGRRDLVEECFTRGGRLTTAAGDARGFYRPHSGFPRWRPSDDPQEVLDEALVWAAKSDRTEVMPLLVARGARVGADPYRGTPLSWAAATGRVAAARWLIEHGADVNQRGTFGGPSHGQGVTALHLASQSGHLEMVRFLIGHGADPTMKDELHGGTALGWAEHGGAAAVSAWLKEFTGPGV